MDYLFGIDFGTGGCKASLIDTKGVLRASAFKEYPSHYPQSGWSEQNPRDWLEALRVTVRSCLEQKVDARKIACLAITASTHNTLIFDRHGALLRPCIMWNDQRSFAETNDLLARAEDLIFDIGMQLPTPTWTLPQLLWIKNHEPEVFGRIHRYYCVKDYIRHFLTGVWGTDTVDAQGTLLFDARRRAWSEEICRLIDLPVEVLPPVHACREILGYVTAEAGRFTGLPEGLPVVAGCSDTSAEDFGAGAVKEGQMIFKLATAANVNLITHEPHPHKKSFTYPHVVENTWYTVLATNSCAASYRWLRDSLFSEEKASFEAQRKEVYEYMNELAAEAPLGSEGMIFHPFLQGERCPYYDAALRASFTGVNSRHGKKHFSRAVLEGVSYSLNDCYGIVKTMNVQTKEARLIGGGAKSKFWSQMVCDVIGIPVIRPLNDDSSFGGALLAGIGIGVFENAVDAAEQCVKERDRLQPNMENHEKYARYFALYQEIVTQMSPVYQKLHQIDV